MFTKRALKQMLADGINEIPISREICWQGFAYTIIPEEGEGCSRPTKRSTRIPEKLEAGITEFDLMLRIDGSASSDSIRKTLLWTRSRPRKRRSSKSIAAASGQPGHPEVAQDFIDHLFFKSAYYDLSGVGRLKINLRLGHEYAIRLKTLRKEDILLTAKTLVELQDTQGVVDDIDHLGNRRVRAVGELLENQYRIGLVRMERAIKERMSLQEVDA
jgi:DNA-directed RNA polymerase subunit beta